MSYSLAGKNVLVTGASSGIGAALAEGFAERGATVGICARREERLHDVLLRLQEYSPKSRSWTVDLSDLDGIAPFARRADDELGGIDVLVNNAGIPKRRPVTELSPDVVESVMALNYSSPVAYRGRPNTGAYTTIKAGIAGLTKVLAGELGPRGIRVNAIAPGSVPTPATEGFVTPEQYEQRAKAIPLRRNGTPEDVAAAAAFLLSDEAAFINGAMLAIDGGIIAAG